MDRPRKVNRIHELDYNQVKVNTEGIKRLYKVEERYGTNIVAYWFEDQDGVKYRSCLGSDCHNYIKAEDSTKSWECQECANKTAILELAVKNKELYRDNFYRRCKDATAAAREELPRARIRLGRNRNVLIFDDQDGVRRDINNVLGRFNLKLDYPKGLDHQKAAWYRKEAKFIDINPFRRLEKVINGEEYE